MLLTSDVAFLVGFGIFLVALAVLAVITLTWAVRRDRRGRAAWRARRAGGPPRSRGGDE